MKNGAIISEWSDKATLSLAGKTIKEVRYMTDYEMATMMWHKRGPVIVFEDGSRLFPSKDEEGNGPGALFTDDGYCPIIPTI